MDNAVLFTRQRCQGAAENEQQILEKQISVIEAYAAQKNLRIVDRVAKTGISAHEMCDMLLSYLRDHPEVRAIITYSWDRLARGSDDFAALHGALTEGKIKLFIARKNERPSAVSSMASSARFLHAINVVASQKYVNQLRKKCRKGMGVSRRSLSGSAKVATDRPADCPLPLGNPASRAQSAICFRVNFPVAYLPKSLRTNFACRIGKARDYSGSGA